ncbi:hypothetical protein PAXRUDRAFT_799375 [Paxillus rubicundulus Ve08.2h10]|uniref:Uncharacterized protein n=1 Tax=Paxillus rubicundulus Ve08.2h10 TaxID=930991 RepID=A0A0D0BKW4_9AGAM|nr:hypothetical protein PAXRUDRAFT_799375 [Paxillus rubicundulus Ve08.2h10]
MLYGLQSRVVLQDSICDQYQSQLEAQQEKGQQKKGQLVGNGLPQLPTSDEFTMRVLKFHNAQAAQETTWEVRKVDQENRVTLMKIWKEEESA